MIIYLILISGWHCVIFQHLLAHSVMSGLTLSQISVFDTSVLCCVCVIPTLRLWGGEKQTSMGPW